MLRPRAHSHAVRNTEFGMRPSRACATSSAARRRGRSNMPPPGARQHRPSPNCPIRHLPYAVRARSRRDVGRRPALGVLRALHNKLEVFTYAMDAGRGSSQSRRRAPASPGAEQAVVSPEGLVPAMRIAGPQMDRRSPSFGEIAWTEPVSIHPMSSIRVQRKWRTHCCLPTLLLIAGRARYDKAKPN